MSNDNPKQELLLEDANNAGFQRHLNEIEAFLETQQADIEEYDEDLARRLLERVTVYDDHLTFEFKSGIEIDITMQPQHRDRRSFGGVFFV